MRQRRGRRERTRKSAAPGNDQQAAASAQSDPAEPTTLPDGIGPPAPWPSQMQANGGQAGYDQSAPPSWLPGSQPRQQYDERPAYGQPPPPAYGPPPPAYGQPPPAYGPAQPYDQTRPREHEWQRDQSWPFHQPQSQEPGPSFEPQRDPRQPYGQQSYGDSWPQPEPPRRYETRDPFEPLTRYDGPQPGPQAVPSTIAAPSQAPIQPVPGVPPAEQPGQPRKRRRRGLIATLAVVVVLLLGAGAAAGGYVLLHTHGSPAQTAASYLNAWQRGDYQAMGRVSLDVPGGGLAGPFTAAKTQLGIRHTLLSLGRVTISGNTAQARFTVTDDLVSNHLWTYQGELSLVVAKRHWWVKWSPSAIYPGLKPGERFALTAIWPQRAQILAADGTALSSPGTISQSGSLALLTGYLGKATTAQAKALGAPYRKGDVIGLSGIEQTYQDQLAGHPSLIIKIVGPGKRVDATAMRFAAKLGTPVRTSINLATQIAASRAVSSAKTNKPVDLVAMQASTGRVLAVVERPGGFDRALQGIFPPGSTFKVVTASALARTGLTPASPVSCPSQVTIDGRTFHNDKNEHLGSTNLQTAFAVSCNSTFALLATQRLSGPTLASMAREFGYNAKPELGLPASLGRFTTPHDPVDLAADAFGQGTDLVNPLSQAAEVAAIDSGTWRPPLLVVSPRPRQKARPHAISPAILDTLRPMMRAVVTGGTAAGVGFPPGVYGKTGTAEYGTGPHPNAHGWFIGYQGDIAFAVLVEGGGYGANSAGPIANAFLRKLAG